MFYIVFRFGCGMMHIRQRIIEAYILIKKRCYFSQDKVNMLKECASTIQYFSVGIYIYISHLHSIYLISLFIYVYNFDVSDIVYIILYRYIFIRCCKVILCASNQEGGIFCQISYAKRFVFKFCYSKKIILENIVLYISTQKRNGET